MLPFVSVAGRDPIWRTAQPRPAIAPEDVDAPFSAEAVLTEAGRALTVLGQDVAFDDERGLWYADVDLSAVAAASYFSFIRLALARHQANSVAPEHRLSPPAETEPIQLPPHRSLRVSHGGAQVSAVLEGRGPGAFNANAVTCHLQVFDTGQPETPADPRASLAGWSTIVTRSGVLGQRLDLHAPQVGGRPLRVLVEERETELRNAASSVPTERPLRLVYADIVDLAV